MGTDLPSLLIKGMALAAVACASARASDDVPPLGWNGSYGSLPTKEQYLVPVTDLPNVPLNLAHQYAGYIPVDGVLPETTQNGYLFFWMHESLSSPETDPVVIWLNGGPGCSSLLGMLYECGPYLINQDGTFNANRFGWNNENNLVFVEQPVETGYAFSEDHRLVDDEDHLGRDFYGFLRNFYRVFPDLEKRKLYIVGESYAGMYCPAIAREVKVQNSKPENKEAQVNLKGIALGNGWVDALIQTSSYAGFAYAHGLVDLEGKKWIDEEWRTCLAKTLPKTADQLTAGDIDKCSIMEKSLELAGFPNEYDTRTYLSYDYLDDPKGAFSTFLNSKAVQQAVHVTGGFTRINGSRNWAECNDNIVMEGDHPLSMVPVIADLLTNLRVLVYNGATDFNCNLQGTEAYLDTMVWKGAQQWRGTARSMWKVDGGVAGYAKSVDNLTFVVVLNSGHLVPMDQPENSLDLIHRFTRGLPFTDEPLAAPYLQVKGVQDGSINPVMNPGGGVHAGLLFGDSTRMILFITSFIGGSILALLGSIWFARHRSQSQYESVHDPSWRTPPMRLRV